MSTKQQQTTERQQVVKTVLESFLDSKKAYIEALENLNERRPITYLRCIKAETRFLRVKALAERINPFILCLNEQLKASEPFYPRDETGLLLAFNEANKSFKEE